jgi:hypothetical protein
MESSNLSVADTGIPGGAVVDKIASDLGHGLLVNAKTKSAQSDADAGNYWTLRPYLKSLITIPQYIIDQVKGQNISYFAVLQLPAQGVGASNTTIITALQAMTKNPNMAGVTGQAAKPAAQSIIGSGGTAVAAGSPEAGAASTKEAGAASTNLKTYLPYIIGAIILGIIIYLIVKSKK